MANNESSIVLIVHKSDTLESDWQSKNAWFPINVIDSGNSIFLTELGIWKSDKLSQEEKAQFPIESIDAWIETLFNDLQSLNADSRIAVIPCGISISVSEKQPLKQWPPKFVTVSGIEISFNGSLFEKVAYSIDVRVDGNLTSSREIQFDNADSPIVLIESVNSTFSMLYNYWMQICQFLWRLKVS